MEHKIGEIISLPDGRKAEVVEGDGHCHHCLFFGYHCGELQSLGIKGYCLFLVRTDHKNIIYKEIKEK